MNSRDKKYKFSYFSAACNPVGRLVTDGGRTAKLQEEYRNGAKTAAAILHEYAVLKELDKPQ